MTKKKEPINPWMVATIVLGIIFLLILFSQDIQNLRNPPEETITVGAVEGKASNFKALGEMLSFGESMEVCNLESRECIMLQKVKQ